MKKENAEVTRKTIRPKGSTDGSKTAVVVNAVEKGKIKKNIVMLCLTTLAAGNMVGMYLNWEPWMWHVFYPTSGVFVTGVLTTFLSKME